MRSRKSQTTAQDIVRALRVRHAEDVFVPECNCARGSLRMDAWAMRRSWTRPATWGYEIKVSRADWLADRKYHLYAPFCNELCVVCPPDVVLPNEVGDGCGLLYTTSGTRLRTIVKPALRNPQIPEEFYRALLMSRVRIVDSTFGDGEDRRTHWTRWLQQREEDRAFGAEVRGKLARLHKERVVQVQNKQRELEKQLGLLQETARWLEERKIGLRGHDTWSLRRELERKLLDVVSPDLLWALESGVQNGERLVRDLRALQLRLQEIKAQTARPPEDNALSSGKETPTNS